MQYFVMLETQDPKRIIPLVDIRGNVLLFPTVKAATEGTDASIMAQAFGYAIHERH